MLLVEKSASVPGGGIEHGDEATLWLAPLDEPAGPPRQVVAGAPADLCLLTGPLATALGDPATATVRLTIRGGGVVAGDS